MEIPLNLSAVDPRLRDQARAAFDRGDPLGFVFLADSGKSLGLVFDNLHPLRERGIYEAALVQAFTGCRGNHSHWPEGTIDFLFRMADREKIRAAGDPIPEESQALFRGVSGVGRQRRKRGWSWTDSLDVACWFACRVALANPAVLTLTVDPAEILCCINDRNEREFLLKGDGRKVNLSAAEIESRATRHTTAARAAERMVYDGATP